MSVIATKILFYLLSLLKWHLSFQRIPESHRQAQSRSEARLVLIVLEVIEKTFQTTVRHTYSDVYKRQWLQFSDGTEYPLYLDKGDNIKIKGSAAELTSLEITGNVPNDAVSYTHLDV